MNCTYNIITVILVVTSAFLGLVSMYSHFGVIDAILIILQSFSIFLFASAMKSKNDGFRLRAISGETLVIFILSATIFLTCIVCAILGLPLLNYLMVVLYCLFSGLGAMMAFPDKIKNEDSMLGRLLFFVLFQVVLTVTFGFMPHQPKPWSWWL